MQVPSTELTAIPTPAAPVAEPGDTTSEWKMLWTAVGTAGAGALVTLATNHLHFLTGSDITAIDALVTAVVALAVAWILGRSFRKHGTTA